MPLKRKQSRAVITAGVSRTEISNLPLEDLKLQLDQFYLPHGSNKQAIVKRLYDYMQKRQAPEVKHLGAASSDHYTDRDSSTGSNPSCDSDSSCDNSDPSYDSDSSNPSDRLGSEDGASCDTAGGDVAGGRSEVAAIPETHSLSLSKLHSREL